MSELIRCEILDRNDVLKIVERVFKDGFVEGYYHGHTAGAMDDEIKIVIPTEIMDNAAESYVKRFK